MQAMLSPNPHYHLLNYVTSGELLSAAKPWFYCLLNGDKDSTHCRDYKRKCRRRAWLGADSYPQRALALALQFASVGSSLT